MYLTKLTNTKYFWLAIFVFFFLLTRLPGLSYDSINPDGVNWHNRAEQFIVGLKANQLERTYQHYQPGVTLMWLVGPTVEIIKQLNGDIVYNNYTFLVFDYSAKIVLIFAQLLLSIYGIYILSKVIGFNKSLLTFALLSFEPFFLANSRLLHLDVLLTLFCFIGLILSYLAIIEGKNKWAVLAGLFFGLAILTKSVGIGGMLFASGVGGIYVYRKSGIKSALKYSCSILLFSILAFIVLFPAMWVDARNVLFYMYDGIERVGIRKGHNQILFGASTRDGGWIFYPLVFLIKSSPFLLVGIAVFISSLKSLSKESKKLLMYLGIFFLGYLVVMSISTKKIDRYFIPVIPYFTLAVALMWDNFQDFFKRQGLKILIVLLFGFSIIYPIIMLYPYYFTYTNPMFGSPAFIHNNLLAQKPFGIGVVELKNVIIERYGSGVDYPTLGFYDKKPMGAIYRGSRIFDVELDGTKRYDILVLGVNEEMPKKVLESEYKYNLDYVMKINGLDYWFLYVKEN